MLASSATSSSSVATLSVALAEAAANVTDVGGVPLTETDTDTVSAASVAPVRESVNAAAVPSVTDVADAAIDTTVRSDDDRRPPAP